MVRTPRSRRPRLLIAAAAGGIALLLVGIGIYGLARGPASSAIPKPPTPSSTPAQPAGPGPTGARPASIILTGDPEMFARSVAVALFTWDSASSSVPADYAQVVIDAGNPAELDALASDVRAYLPTSEAWAQLRTYQTHQWLTIDTAEIPQAWRTAEAQARPGQLPPGTTAYTVTGTRHRGGIWGTTSQEASRPVSFTVFIACPRPAPDIRGVCTLLRLSAPDNPLR